MLVFVLLVALARALRTGYRRLAAWLDRYMGARAARALGLVTLVALVVLVLDGILWTGIIRAVDRSLAVGDLLTPDGVALFDELTAGKDADAPIFTHKDGRPWKKSEQSRPMAEANTKAKLDPSITLTRLRKAYGSLLLNAGVSLEIVSKAMGHSDPRVTRRHYSRLLQSTIDTEIRAALPSLGSRRRKVARFK